MKRLGGDQPAALHMSGTCTLLNSTLGSLRRCKLKATPRPPRSKRADSGQEETKLSIWLPQFRSDDMSNKGADTTPPSDTTGLPSRPKHRHRDTKSNGGSGTNTEVQVTPCRCGPQEQNRTRLRPTGHMRPATQEVGPCHTRLRRGLAQFSPEDHAHGRHVWCAGVIPPLTPKT